MALSPVTDLGAHVKGAYCGCTNLAGAPSVATAADGTVDNVAVTGATIDRLGYDSCVVSFAWLAALTAVQTLSIAAEYQESADDSTWATAVALQTSTVVATGAGNKSGVTEFDLNLRGKKRYIRFNFTPNLSHSGTDTAIVTATAQLGGAADLPAA